MGVSGQQLHAARALSANWKRLGWSQGRSGRVLEKKKSITPTGVQTLDGYVLIIYLCMIRM
jgi:hypothetical protein